MAEHVMTGTMRMGAALTGLLLAAGWGMAQARDLPDPTRPPARMLNPVVTAAPAGPVLQAVIISGRRRTALINGRMVRRGDRMGHAEVVRIGKSEVVLRSGHTLHTVKLFPRVQKRPIARERKGKNQ